MEGKMMGHALPMQISSDASVYSSFLNECHYLEAGEQTQDTRGMQAPPPTRWAATEIQNKAAFIS